MSSCFRSSAFPTPDSIRSWGELMAPPLNITSFSANTWRETRKTHAWITEHDWEHVAIRAARWLRIVVLLDKMPTSWWQQRKYLNTSTGNHKRSEQWMLFSLDKWKFWLASSVRWKSLDFPKSLQFILWATSASLPNLMEIHSKKSKWQDSWLNPEKKLRKSLPIVSPKCHQDSNPSYLGSAI